MDPDIGSCGHRHRHPLVQGPVVFEVSPIFDLNPEPPAEWKQKPYREPTPQVMESCFIFLVVGGVF